MPFSRAQVLACTLGLLAVPSQSHAGEGQWRPAQIHEIPKDRSKGLELTPDELWGRGGDEREGGLLRAAVNLSGCSAAFVSPDGLIATNHHCAYSALQANSKPGTDYITDGFLAADRSAELPATGKTVRVVRSIVDVTDRVRAPEWLRDLRWAVADCDRKKDPETKAYCGCAGKIAGLLESKDIAKDAGPYPDSLMASAPRFQRCQKAPGARPVTKPRSETSDELVARETAREHQIKTIVDACESRGGGATRCRVAEYDHGARYELIEYLELRDVRVVYAPPRAVGEYGGDVDNWMWPRHTGDFTLLRAYVNAQGDPADPDPSNVPYTPGQYLRVSTEGVKEGDFVAVLGYPGHTDRFLSLAQMDRQIEQVLPMRVEVYGEWIAILERLGATDEAIKIKVASTRKSLANVHKNARGMLDGIEKMDLRGRRAKEEDRIRKWASKPKRQGYLRFIDEIAEITAADRATYPGRFLLGNLRRGPGTLAIAVDLVRNAREAAKKDGDRASGFRDRDLPRTWKRQERRLRDFDPTVDSELLAAFTGRAHAWADDPGLDALRGVLPSGASVADARTLVDSTALSDKARVKAAFDARSLGDLESDPLVVAAEGIVDQIERNERASKARDARMADLGPAYLKLLRQIRKGPMYSDANGTLRISMAHVKPYTKWNGDVQVPQTKLAGAIAKHTGKEPFDLPEKVLEAAKNSGTSQWRDANLNDVPVCFTSDADTTGGNSGSPVIDGKGRLVGLNFDRVWENIAGDFGYNPPTSRNVSVDVRYLLWHLAEVESADALLTELGVERVAPAPAPEAEPPPAAPPKSDPPAAGAPPSGGCACGTTDGDPTAAAAFGLLLVCGSRRRRKLYS